VRRATAEELSEPIPASQVRSRAESGAVERPFTALTLVLKVPWKLIGEKLSLGKSIVSDSEDGRGPRSRDRKEARVR